MIDREIFVCKRCGERYFYFHRRIVMLTWDKKWNDCGQCRYQSTCPYHQKNVKDGMDPACFRKAIPVK